MEDNKDYPIRKGLLLFIPMVLIYACTHFQRTSVPGTLFNELQKDMGLNAIQVAALGACFVWIYSIFQLFAGGLADKYSGTRLTLYSCIPFLIGVFVFPCVHSPILLYASRICIGIGSSAMFLSLIKETDRFFGRQNYSFFMGLVYFIGYGGGLIGTMPLSLLSEHFYWRHLMLVAAGVSLFSFLFLLFERRRVTLPPVKSGFLSFRPMGRAIMNPWYWLSVSAAGFNFTCYSIIQTVLGKKFLLDYVKMSPAAASSVIFSLTLVCMSGCLFTGSLCRHLGNHRKPFAIFASFTAFSAILLLILAVHFQWSAWVYVLSYNLSAFSTGFTPIFTMLTQEMNSKEELTQGPAFSNMFHYMSVSIFTLLFGFILEKFPHTLQPDGSTLYATKAYLTAFLCLECLAIISLVFTLILPETNGKFRK